VTETPSPLLLKSLAVASVAVLTLVNAFGATLMGRSETVIVAIKVAMPNEFVGCHWEGELESQASGAPQHQQCRPGETISAIPVEPA
jgi:hypothetical protein